MHSLDQLKRVSIKQDMVELFYPFQGKVQITSPQQGMFHIAFLQVTDWSEQTFTPSESILHTEKQELLVEEREHELVISIKGGKAIVQKEPFGIRFLNADDQEVAHSPAGWAYEFDGWRVRTSFVMNQDERIYGLGESDINQSHIPLDHRGTIRPIWNKHLPAPSRLLIPVLYSSAGYGLFIDNSWTARFDFGVEHEDRWFYEAEGGVLNYYFFYGDSLPALVDQYTQLTGRPELPPLWSFGYLQSKFGYRNRAEVEELAAAFRVKQIPCDSIILDLYWFKHMGDLAFDQDAFPEPEEMIDQLKADGFHTIVIEEPYVTKASRFFAEGDRQGYFGRRSDGTSYTFPFWPGESALVDFTNPQAQLWWGQQHIPLMKMGIAGWWTDLNEPEVHPPDMVHHNGSAFEVHNRFAFAMHQAISQAHEAEQPEKRLFIMSRSAWAGSQRYGVGVWSGDVDTTWDHLQKQVSLGLSMGLAGLPLWNTDIGGFKGEEPSGELFVRWVQFGAFNPTMRPHGAQQSREPWAFGSEVEAIVKRYIEWRYRLMPYIYTLAYEAYRTGNPYMRPLMNEDLHNERYAQVHDQYLFGDSLLIAPVIEEGARSRKVVLPEGRWYDFWSGRSWTGGNEIVVAAPLETLPIFVRAGGIIPLIPIMQHTAESPWSDMTLQLYPADAGEFWLYEDDGHTTSYKEGAFRTTCIRQFVEPQKWTIEINEGSGTYNGMIMERQLDLQLFDVAQVEDVRVNGCSWDLYRQEGQCLKIFLNKRSIQERIVIEVVGSFI